jgi:hypothetical protein
MSASSQIVHISNKTVSVSVDKIGGAIVDFHLHVDGLNPLTFKRAIVNFQGHFLCLGRWGAPSAGEAAAGIVEHGEAVTQVWVTQASTPKNKIVMQVNSPLEGLHVDRVITLDEENPVFSVKEDIKNINPLARLYNVVQHPTLGKPFLTADTIVNCNADKGFNYMLNKKPLEHAAQWPFGIVEDWNTINLSKLDKAYNSVFSFAVKKGVEYGWITSYSPENNLLIGYLWKREDYPWISLWQDFEGDDIRYRGLEFGTTGMHKPYKEIIEEGNHRVFNEDSYKYIDAGETQSKGYIAFLYKPPADFTEVTDVDFNNGRITIQQTGDKHITIQTTLKS